MTEPLSDDARANKALIDEIMGTPVEDMIFTCSGFLYGMTQTVEKYGSLAEAPELLRDFLMAVLDKSNEIESIFKAVTD